MTSCQYSFRKITEEMLSYTAKAFQKLKQWTTLKNRESQYIRSNFEVEATIGNKTHIASANC